jgi:cobalt-precorrin 5A hydrolase
MTGTVVIALPRFMHHAERVAAYLGADIQEYTPDVFAGFFGTAEKIVAIMSLGIAVRQIGPLLRDKWTDPAVVVISPDFIYAIPLTGGHHGANDLARHLAGLGLTPVITTATESTGRESVEKIAERAGCDIVNRISTRQVNGAILDGDVPVHPIQGPAVVIAGPAVSLLVSRGEYCIGIGCRKGATQVAIKEAIRSALSDAGIGTADVMIYATTEKKRHERGLIDAIGAISGNLIFLDDDTINAQETISSSAATRLGLSGVAEPCAIAYARRKELIMKKRVHGTVTIAIAR